MGAIQVGGAAPAIFSTSPVGGVTMGAAHFRHWRGTAATMARLAAVLLLTVGTFLDQGPPTGAAEFSTTTI